MLCFFFFSAAVVCVVGLLGPKQSKPHKCPGGDSCFLAGALWTNHALNLFESRPTGSIP